MIVLSVRVSASQEDESGLSATRYKTVAGRGNASKVCSTNHALVRNYGDVF